MPEESDKPAKAAKPAKSAQLAKPAKPVKSAKPAKSVKPAKSAGKPAAARKRTTRSAKPSHEEIAERAYFIHLEAGGRDELGNWLRAEDELTTP